MKPIRWTAHALQGLIDRDIDRGEVEQALVQPELTVPDPPDREIRMRRYQDPVLGQPMLLRVVVEESAAEMVVVTVYKTSQVSRYLRGMGV